MKVTLKGAELAVRPASKLTPELRRRLGAEKAEMVAALAAPILEPLGRVNERGEFTIPAADLAVFAERLRSMGWDVSRKGDVLDCKPQAAKRQRRPKGKAALAKPRLRLRVLNDSLVATAMGMFDAELTEVTDLREKS